MKKRGTQREGYGRERHARGRYREPRSAQECSGSFMDSVSGASM